MKCKQANALCICSHKKSKHREFVHPDLDGNRKSYPESCYEDGCGCMKFVDYRKFKTRREVD